jgi:hypothetical protein
MSNLLKHAEQEMRLAGLYDEDADYGGMIPEAVLKVVKVFSEEGHSGYSARLTGDILQKVLRFQTLTPINSDPQFWMEVSAEQMGRPGVWQSTRDGTYFSEDGGQTFYCLDDPEKKNFPKRFRE